MTDPRRLSDVGDAFQQALLRSARRDHGSLAAQARCIAAVSTTAAAAAHAGGAAAATGASIANAASIAKTAIGGASVGSMVAVKAVAIGLALGLGAHGAILVANHGSKTREEPRTRSMVQSTSPRVRGVTAVRERAAEALPALAGSTLVVENPSRASGSPTPTPPRAAKLAPMRAAATPDMQAAPPASQLAEPTPDVPATVNDSLEREVALMDEARLACRAKDYVRALTLLDRHQQEFSHGSLGPEALVIRVQALVGLGRRAEAERLARPYLSNYESSPITKRLRSVLER